MWYWWRGFHVVQGHADSLRSLVGGLEALGSIVTNTICVRKGAFDPDHPCMEGLENLDTLGPQMVYSAMMSNVYQCRLTNFIQY